MKCALIPIVVLPKTSPRPRISRALLRHTLREQIRCVSDGLDPMNVIRDERLNRTIPTNAWSYFRQLIVGKIGESVQTQ
jgi:hypothetical protein